MITFAKSKRSTGEISVRLFDNGEPSEILVFDNEKEWLEYKESEGLE